ncbi:hypothetical protein C0992_004834 [Termitomyces sp. T32_za158]|nr:hypothetical protein C0992_004834 [Termitomyces sp. T32_za158]
MNNNNGGNDNNNDGGSNGGDSGNNNNSGNNDNGDHRPDTIEVEGAEESQLEEDGFQGELLPVSHRFSSSSMMTHSSSATNISSILDACQTLPSTVQDERKSPPELLSDVRHLCMQMRACLNRILGLEAELTVSNSHCTLMRHELSDFRTKLDNTRAKKTWGSTKIKACFLTHPELKEAFEKEEVECQKWDQINAEKEAQKA